MGRRGLLAGVAGVAGVAWALAGPLAPALADPQVPSSVPAPQACPGPDPGACSPGGGGDQSGAPAPGQPVAGLGPGLVLSAVGQWVASGAAWLLGQVGSALDKTTRPDLSAGWFTAHMKQMTEVCAFLVLPLLLAAVIQAVARQDLGGLVRAVLVRLPLAILLTAVAVQLVQLCLAAVDSLSATVAQGAGLAAPGFMGQVAQAISLGGGGVPLFVGFVASLLIAVGAFVLWLELVLRAAAIYVAVLFLPLALAGLVWQATWHWSRRLAETLAALVLSKL
ncbi:MAG TPA: hypothetical protein VKY15_03210, partial [Acidimicrobiales bacterium]|nr:hypothetical protein [Acidimicrobiales bacterium]